MNQKRSKKKAGSSFPAGRLLFACCEANWVKHPRCEGAPRAEFRVEGNIQGTKERVTTRSIIHIFACFVRAERHWIFSRVAFLSSVAHANKLRSMRSKESSRLCRSTFPEALSSFSLWTQLFSSFFLFPFKIRLAGERYDANALWKDSEKLTELFGKGSSQASARREEKEDSDGALYRLGSGCNKRTELFHRLHHYKYNLAKTLYVNTKKKMRERQRTSIKNKSKK